MFIYRLRLRRVRTAPIRVLTKSRKTSDGARGAARQPHGHHGPSIATSYHRMARRYRIAPARIPASTYRVQLNHRFTFSQAADIADYLHDLGVGSLYASPFLMAHPDSLHGYDITRHCRLNPEIGSRED